MGLFKGSLKLANEIFTLGGAGRLAEAKREYESANEELRSLIARTNAHHARINSAVSAIGDVLTRAKPHLEGAERLIRFRVDDLRDLDVAIKTQTLRKVERFNAGMDSAINVGVGSIAGGSMAVGAWSLVTIFGSASTGTAISGLSGVAATNATLAWFGGGALAAGGAGMAGGVAVLGGIVAVPLVYVAATRTHKKAKELEDAKVKVEESIFTVCKELERLPSIVEQVEARRREAERLCNDIVATILKLKRVIRPYGVLSLTKQLVLEMLGRPPYCTAQLDAISELTRALAQFLAAFDAQASDDMPGTQRDLA